MTEPRRWLVTGAAGRLGRRVVAQLRALGEVVTGAGHDAAVQLDLRDPDAVLGLVEKYRPTHVVHVAGTSSLEAMRRDPTGGNENIVLPAVNLFEAVKKAAPHARVLLGSCSVVYGNQPDPGTATPMRPVDLFGAAKASVEWMAERYAKQGVTIVVARAFPTLDADSVAARLIDLARHGTGLNDVR